jgi:hypothetical protein
LCECQKIVLVSSRIKTLRVLLTGAPAAMALRPAYGGVWFEFETCYLRLRIIVSVKLVYANIQQKYIIILHSFALFYIVSMSIELYF